MAIRQLEEGRAEVENQYVRAVKREGVPLAQRQIFEVFEVGERKWRGVGEIPASGYRLRDAYARFDAEQKFDVGEIRTNEHPACIAGAILTGEKLPLDCTAYGTLCTPQKPLGRADGQLGGHVRRVLLGGPRARRGAIAAAGHAVRADRTDRRARRCRGVAVSMDPKPFAVPDGSLALTEPTAAGTRVHRPRGRLLPGADRRGRAGDPGPRLRRPALERAPARRHRAGARRGLARRPAQRRGRRGRGRARASPSPPTRSSSARSGSPAATSASWPSTARSTTSR